MSDSSYQYLIKCKELCLQGVIPATSVQLQDDSFLILKALSDSIIEEKGFESFYSFIYEGAYLIQLWTAHLILTQKNVKETIQEKCILEIEKYSNNPLALLVAIEEKKWLDNYNKIM